MHTLYHGTSSINLDCIKKVGLEPGHANGGDVWATEHHMSVGKVSVKRGPQVFVSSVREKAEDFANIAAEEMGGDPIIIVLHVPAQVFATFHVDELFHSDLFDGEPEAWRAPRIPAECIGEVLPAKKHAPFGGGDFSDDANTILSMLSALLSHH
jgi:hypothetical protein